MRSERRLAVAVLLAVPRCTCYGLLAGSTARHASRAVVRARVRCGLQVVTDIDDTVKSSGGVTLAGIPLGGVDPTYTRNAIYPGVFSFGLELASHSAGWGRVPDKVAVLTARAEEFKWALEIKQSSALCVGFREAGEARGFGGWGVGPVLYGSVAEWICQERKGWRKFENFKLLRGAAVLEGEARPRYVFIGDNGVSEKDLEAAQMIITEFPGALRAVFLHAVSGTARPAPLPPDTEYDGVPIRYFRTYPAAAAKAARLGLLGAAGARRVIDAAEADMAKDPLNIAPGGENEALLLAEIGEARSRLGPSLALPSLPSLPGGGGGGGSPPAWRTGLGRLLNRRGGEAEGEAEAGAREAEDGAEQRAE